MRCFWDNGSEGRGSGGLYMSIGVEFVSSVGYSDYFVFLMVIGVVIDIAFHGIELSFFRLNGFYFPLYSCICDDRTQAFGRS